MKENSVNILNQEIVDMLGVLTDSEKKTIKNQTISNNLLPYVMGSFFFTIVLTVIFTANFDSFKKSAEIVAPYIFAVILFIAYILNLRTIRNNIQTFNTALSHYMRETICSLKKVDYFCRSPFSGLAIDVEEKKIALIEGDLIQPTDTKVIIYPLDKIKSVRFFEPDVNINLQSTNINNGGTMGLAQNVLTSIVDKELNNGAVLRANIEAAKSTGLYFEFDDIHNQQAFLMMSTEQAERWIMIFEKLFDGSLEPQPRPLEFPQGVCVFPKKRTCE